MNFSCEYSTPPVYLQINIQIVKSGGPVYQEEATHSLGVFFL